MDQLRNQGIELLNNSARTLEDLQARLAKTLQNIQQQTLERQRQQDDSARVPPPIRSSEDLDVQVRNDAVASPSRSDHDLIQQLGLLKSLVESMPQQNRILRRLHFEGMTHRENMVAPPESHTFRWMLAAHSAEVEATVNGRTYSLPGLPDDQLEGLERLAEEQYSNDKSSFQDLETLRRCRISRQFHAFLELNSGTTFFIHGKAGCGKSTIMKYLGHNEIVENSLRTWASGRKLVIIRAFFWRSTDSEQNSLRGFYRTVLYHTLRQCPELVGEVFPCQGHADDPDAAEIQIYELEEAFKRLVELMASSDTHRFCLFADGLDEYEGDNIAKRDLSLHLASWADSSAVKVVCSARPYPVIVKVFEPKGVCVEFHRLTRSDIFEFAESQISNLLEDDDHRRGRETCLNFVDHIVDKAEGVFLWASLVVKSLINGAMDGDTEKDLRQRLEDCPPDLNRLFQQMLDGVDPSPSVRRRSTMILYIAAFNPFREPLNALTFSWLDDVNWFQDDSNTFPLGLRREELSDGGIKERHERVRKMLYMLTRGLLVLQKLSHSQPFFGYRVDFFHRSAHDYVKKQWFAEGCQEKPFKSLAEQLAAYSRLRVAEAKYFPTAQTEAGSIEHIRLLRPLVEFTLYWFLDCARKGTNSPFTCLDEFHALTLSSGSHSENPWKRCFLGHMMTDEDRSWRWFVDTGVGCSFVHMAAYWRQGAYVRHQIESGKVVLNVESGGVYSPVSTALAWCRPGPNALNLLLSSSVSADVETTKWLLGRGLRSCQEVGVSLNRGDPRTYVVDYVVDDPYIGFVNDEFRPISIWLIYLRDFAANVRAYSRKRRLSIQGFPYLDRAWLNDLAAILEAHLRHGADPTVTYLITTPTDTSHARLSLRQLLDIFSPPNLTELDSLLAPRLASVENVWHKIKEAWTPRFVSTTRQAEANEAETQKHSSLTLDYLLHQDWSVAGVITANGEGLLGEFIWRVF